MTLEVGTPWPLGVSLTAAGANFVVFSAHATRVVLCVFDPAGVKEIARYDLPSREGDLWYGFLPGAQAGLIYGYRVWGPYQPEQGHLFNPNKVLLDPYAREIVGSYAWRSEHLGFVEPSFYQFSTVDNASWALKGRLIEADTFDWEGDCSPRVPMHQRVMYEAHPKGLTQLHPGIPPEQRGTYAALAHPALIQYLRDLGVTSLNLLPVYYFLDEAHLVRSGLTNYWGYNPISFFAPTDRYWRPGLLPPNVPDNPRVALQTAIKALHAAGIEVILDVVYNHSAEGDTRGPTLSFRGLDHASYYWLADDHSGNCINWSGCGNSLNLQHSRVMQLVLDSLRYWVETFHVDGFRFDLAPILGRTARGFDPNSPFLLALRQDPILSRVTLIAEPWDLGWGGYQLGHFPSRFLEWNDRFRDTARQYWLRGTAGRGELARRLTASSDIFHHHQRTPMSTVNYVAVHDGFTLRDLVSYQQKHNEANGEQNRDGRDENFSINCGVEGPSVDPKVERQRQRLQKAMLATLFLGQGTPLLQAGDEWGRTQRGNNNAYCQDNDLAWLDWSVVDHELLEFTQQLIRLRQNLLEPYRNWLLGHPVRRAEAAHLSDDSLESRPRDIVWWAPRGHAMAIHDWHDSTCHALGVLVTDTHHQGDYLESDKRFASLLLLFNPHEEPISFQLPEANWVFLLTTAEQLGFSRIQATVPAQAMVILGLTIGEPFPNIPTLD